MHEELQSVLLGTAGLMLIAVVALGLAILRPRVVASEAFVRRTAMVAGVAIVLQAVHFGEELHTAFFRRFPELLGLVAWPVGFFVVFNVVWLAIWAWSAWALRSRRWWPLFPLWFLAVAGVANGAAHVAIAVVVRGYFPGLITAPLVGMAGLVLARRLIRLASEAPAAA